MKVRLISYFLMLLIWMSLSNNQLRRVSTSLVRFFRDLIQVEGEITLPVTTGTPPWLSTIFCTFTIIWVPLAYYVILGWSRLNKLDVIISTSIFSSDFWPRTKLVRYMETNRWHDSTLWWHPKCKKLVKCQPSSNWTRVSLRNGKNQLSSYSPFCWRMIQQRLYKSQLFYPKEIRTDY